jgi:nicotinic acid phosphoribosyltransferase
MDVKLQQTHTLTTLFTDSYQFTTSYSYFLCNKHNEVASIECFFGKHPFKDEYTILEGIKETIAFIDNFKITDHQIKYL